MNKVKLYKKQIFTIITIFLLLEFGVYPCLTMANTFANIIGAIALIVLLLWGGIELYEYAKSDEGGIVDKTELKEAEKKWKEHVERQMDEMRKMREQTESLKEKPKAKRSKPLTEGSVKSQTKSDNGLTKAPPPPKPPKKLGEFQSNNKEKVRKSTIKTKTK